MSESMKQQEIKDNTPPKEQSSYIWVFVFAAVVVCYFFWDRIAGVMEKLHIDPAKWLDSPYTFGMVMGIAAAFILFSLILIIAVKIRLSNALAWAGGRTDAMLISLLGSTQAHEREMAYTVLRQRLDERLAEPLVRELKSAVDEEKDPRYMIYLLEDLGVPKAVPTLNRIVQDAEHWPVPVIRAAQQALETIPAEDHSQPQSTSTKKRKKSSKSSKSVR